MSKPIGRALIKFIKANKLFVDPSDTARDRQRNPHERHRSLVKMYGEHGEKYSIEKAGVLLGRERNDGRIALKDGGGRWYCVMELLKQPDAELPVLIQEKTGDLEAFEAANSGLHIPNGKKFMARAADPRFKYEHSIYNVLSDLDITTTPGYGHRSINVNQVIFAFDLGVLHIALTLAKKYWAKDKNRIEGLGLAGIAGFLYIYGNVHGKNPSFDMDRLRYILASVPYDELKEGARGFLPKNKEHQRQWGIAIAKELVTRYNSHKRSGKLNPDLLVTLQEKVIDHEHYKTFTTVWEMRRKIA